MARPVCFNFCLFSNWMKSKDYTSGAYLVHKQIYNSYFLKYYHECDTKINTNTVWWNVLKMPLSKVSVLVFVTRVLNRPYSFIYCDDSQTQASAHLSVYISQHKDLFFSFFQSPFHACMHDIRKMARANFCESPLSFLHSQTPQSLFFFKMKRKRNLPSINCTNQTTYKEKKQLVIITNEQK